MRKAELEANIIEVQIYQQSFEAVYNGAAWVGKWLLAITLVLVTASITVSFFTDILWFRVFWYLLLLATSLLIIHTFRFSVFTSALKGMVCACRDYLRDEIGLDERRRILKDIRDAADFFNVRVVVARPDNIAETVRDVYDIGSE